jgi:carboxymethylenebutenolidase
LQFPRVNRPLSSLAATLLFLSIAAPPARAEWTRGEFTFNDKPVVEFHCIPDKADGPLPAVVLLHGAGRRNRANGAMEKICDELAKAGYYTEFIEYYSQTEDVTPGEPGKIMQYFPIWLGEIRAGIDAMDRNPRIDPKRIGMVGYSLGAYLSLSTGATDPGRIAAIVDYYGGLPPRLHSMASNLPPTLILHGDADVLVPVMQARELDRLMTEANRPHEVHIYPGANHAFNFQIPAWYNPTDAEDAWQHTLDFLGRYLGGKPAPALTAGAK